MKFSFRIAAVLSICCIALSPLLTSKEERDKNTLNGDLLVVRKAAEILKEDDIVEAEIAEAEELIHQQKFEPFNQTSPRQDWENKFSTNIVNDKQWYVDGRKNETIEANYGGKITRLGRYWYWVGTGLTGLVSNVWRTGFLNILHLASGKLTLFICTLKQNGTYVDIVNIYRSASLGSDSWEFVTSVYSNDTERRLRNCQINQHPSQKTYHILCKNRSHFVSDDGILGNYRLLSPKDPSALKDWNFGGTSFFQQGNHMYEVVSRCDKSRGKCERKSRTLFVYLLNDEWSDYHSTRPLVSQLSWPRREAPFVIKRGEWYFLIASETAGWKQSRTWHRRAKSLQALENATDSEVVMHPGNTRKIKSMGSQFRFILEIAYNKWIFVGNRYPADDRDDWDVRYGAYVMTPLRFISNVPHVYWKNEFDWFTYNYSSTDYDAHYHGGRGHSPPIISSDYTNDKVK